MKTIALLTIMAAAGWGRGPLPFAFEPNRGQAPSPAGFVARGPGYSLLLTQGGATLIASGSRVSTSLAGANRAAPAEAEGLLPGKVHYLKGRERAGWLTGIPTYGRVRYRGVYPGIDVLYYGNAGRLEYDFVVSPGANPSRIRLQYEGASGVHVNSGGDLVLDTPDGPVLHHRPVVYQDTAGGRRSVSASYVVERGTVRFALGRYDRALPLVIDPVLTWSTYFGSPNDDEGRGVAVDSAGNVFLAGSTVSNTSDVDSFVSKIDAAGTTAVWTVSVGGVGDDYSSAVAVDSAGNVYLAGQTDSDDFPVEGVTIDLSGAMTDGFLVKLSPDGTQYVYSTYLGGSRDDVIFGLALNPAGNAYVTGGTLSIDFPVTSDPAQKANAGSADAVVSAFDPAGKLAWSTYLGGSGYDVAYAVAADSGGNAYVTGSADSTNFPVTSGALRVTAAGADDAFIVKYGPGGKPLYATYLGGAGNDESFAIAVDSAGAAYVTGATDSSDFPALNAYQSKLNGSSDLFVTKLAPGGSGLGWSTYLGGSKDDVGNAIGVDAAGNAYVAGSTSSTDFPTTDAFQGSNRGSADATVTEFDPAGSKLVFSSYLGGARDDTSQAIAVSCVAGALVAGSTSSTDFPASARALQAASRGGMDAFVALVGAGVPGHHPNGVVNGATFAPAPVAPGSLITVFGANLAAGTALAASTPLATSLAGSGTKVNGLDAPFVYASPAQLNLQVPYETAPGTALAVVTACGGPSTSVPFPVEQAAPYLFLGTGTQVIAQNEDYSINGPGNPARAGSSVVVYLTGIGPLDNPVATGGAAPASPLSRAILANSATIGGQPATVGFLGLTPGFVGLAQANLTVPALSPGTYPVVITVGGAASNSATLVVQ